MKSVITILVALSLYAPSVAKLLAYTDCSIQLLTNSNPNLCDCNKILSDNQVPLSAEKNNQQQKLLQKTDWNFTVLTKYHFNNCRFLMLTKHIEHTTINLPKERAKSIFHPPNI